MMRPNVLFIVLDTARAQNVLPSEQPDVMPNVSSALKDGTQFTQAVTTAPWTLPSHASMFTGQYTRDHNTHAGSQLFSPNIDPLAERLRQEGYCTMGISNNNWVSPAFGFDEGFEKFHRGWELLPAGVDLNSITTQTDDRVEQLKKIAEEMTPSNAPATLLNTLYARFFQNRYDNGALLTNYRIKRWLAKEWDDDRPFFIFANYIEPHLEYDPPRLWRDDYLPKDITPQQASKANQAQWEYMAGNIEMESWEFRALEALYTAELNYLDHRLKNLFAFMREQGILNETLVIVVGDHGENIGDHGLMDHQYSLHETLLRVPLFVRSPGTTISPKRVDTPVEVRDLFPTVLNAADAPQPQSESVSNNSLLSSDPGRDETFAEYVVPQPDIETLLRISNGHTETAHEFERALQCIRTETWKYIRGSDGSEWLFDIASDPDETENVLQHHPETVDQLKRRLNNERGGPAIDDRSTDETIDAATKQRLEELGYI